MHGVLTRRRSKRRERGPCLVRQIVRTQYRMQHRRETVALRLLSDPQPSVSADV